MLQFIITIIALAFLSSSSFAQVCHPDDYTALVRLRDATNGGGGLGSWNTIVNLPNGTNSRWFGSNVYNWHGIDTVHVATFPKYYRIRKVNLDGNNFIGLTPLFLENDIPDSLFVGDGLMLVDSLILSNNNLTGVQGYLKTPIPFSAHQLEHLALDNNQ